MESKTQTYRIGDRHFSTTNEIVEDKKRNPETQKIVKDRKGNCDFCGRYKS